MKYDIKVSWKTPIAVDSVTRDMTDKDVEVRFGLSPIEREAARNGRDTIRPSHIRRICDYFGIEPSELFCEMA